MESTDSSEAGRLPIACTLGPDDGAARMRRWKALWAEVGPSVRRTDHLLEVRYQPQPGLHEELQGLAAAERECCSFAEWKVTREEDQVVLQIRADPGRPRDIDMIAALFCGDDLERPAK